MRGLTGKLNVYALLQSWRTAVTITEKTTDAAAFMLILDAVAMEVRIKGFKKEELPQASEDYLQAEECYRDRPEMQTVLVSVDSLAALRSAYPNYYLDTSAFIKAVKRAIDE